jgi:predicted nucleic acid-binding Zn ribbon protein
MINGCGDCGIGEGELHWEGCDMEICPICKRQLLSCPIHTWKNFKKEEREPYFSDVFCCERCGTIMPDLFMVSNEEWKFICGVTYPLDCILCKGCMEFIKKKRRKKNARV